MGVNQQNPYFSDFLEAVNQRFTEDNLATPHSEWVTKHTTRGGLPFNYNLYPFQTEIINDMHPNLCCIKPSQQGLTEIQLRKALAIVRRLRGVSLIFSLPDEAMQLKVAQTRLQPILDSDIIFNKEKNAGLKQARSVAITQIGQSFLYLVKCGEGEATSTPADFVFNDEVDLSDQTILGLFNSRMQASNYKVNQRFSTPTFDGYGISSDYDLSDQREYFVKCRACTHWQVPIFNEKFVRIAGWNGDVPLRELTQTYVEKVGINIFNSHVCCEKCGSPLNNLSLAEDRNWVPTFQNRVLARGYRVRTFSSQALPPGYVLSQLFAYQKQDFLQGWYNTVLGETYETGDVRLREADILSCFTSWRDVPPVMNGENYFVGIDLGLICHVVIGCGPSWKQCKIVEFKTVKSDEIVKVLKMLDKKYQFKQGSSDRHPYTPTSNEMRDATHGRVVPNEYRGDREVKDLRETEGKIQTDRTAQLDSVKHLVSTQNIQFYGYGDYQEVIKNHLRDMVRKETTEKRATWEKLTGVDHYFHAIGNMVTAMKLYYGDYLGTTEKTHEPDVLYFGTTEGVIEYPHLGLMQPSKGGLILPLGHR